MAPYMAPGSALATAVLFASLSAPVAAVGHVVQLHSWYKDYYPQDEDCCFYGCYNAVNRIHFNYTPVSANAEDYYINDCSNTLMLNSTMYCAQKYCTPAQTRSGRKLFAPGCEKIGIHFPTVEETTLSQPELDAILVLNSTAALATAEKPLGKGVTAIPDREWHGLAVKTVDVFYTFWDTSFDFSFALIGFWGLAITVGAAYRVLTRITIPSRRPSPSWWLWCRRTLILPATFGERQAQAGANMYTIPPRLESILLAIYVVINIVMCFPGYDLFTGNQYYPEKKVQLARYIGDRTGFLSIAQLPMVWVFAARNDPFMWITGWSFATFTRFHRWIARIAVLHAVVHSIAYSFFAGSAYRAYWNAEYWLCGGIATVVMCLMLGASTYYIREKFYEPFLLVHVLMSIVSFVTLWYHVRIFDGEFNYFLYPCIAIWALDRLLRVGRTVFVSIMPRYLKGVKATVTYHRTIDMVRLDITDFFPNKKIAPGLYYYLYMPNTLRGYESHPFTMCSWRRSSTALPDSRSTSLEEKDPGSSVHTASFSEHSTPHSDNTPAEIAHTFLVRPYKGMTGRLQKKLSLGDGYETIASTQETVFLEGPYGTALDLSSCSDVLIVCGGSGITSAISHAHFLTSANSTTTTHIVWAVSQRHLPDDVCANELASVIHTDRVNMTVYLTSAAKEEAQDEMDDETPSRPPYEVRFGRPDVEDIMREHRKRARGSLAVVTCGTPEMSDVCRRAVVKVLGEKKGVEIAYYNQTLLW